MTLEEPWLATHATPSATTRPWGLSPTLTGIPMGVAVPEVVHVDRFVDAEARDGSRGRHAEFTKDFLALIFVDLQRRLLLLLGIDDFVCNVTLRCDTTSGSSGAPSRST